MVGLQRMLAERLGLEVGRYRHFVDHCHVYARDLPQAEAALRRRDAFATEGWLRRAAGLR